ncbi:MAG: XRE family transcriptional regulator [Mycobacterium sp.]
MGRRAAAPLAFDANETFAMRLNRLFDTIRAPGADRPYYSSELLDFLAARGFKFSAPYLSQLRSGVRARPSTRSLELIGEFFGVDPNYLAGTADIAYTKLLDDDLDWLALTHNSRVRRITTALIGLPEPVREQLLHAATQSPSATGDR